MPNTLMKSRRGFLGFVAVVIVGFRQANEKVPEQARRATLSECITTVTTLPLPNSPSPLSFSTLS